MALIKCRECGKDISDTSKKCIHCGADVILKIKCTECNNEFDNTTNICPFCGKKNTNNISASVKDTKKSLKKFFTNNKQKTIIIGSIALAVIIFGIILAKVIPPMLVSVDEYLSEGNYQKAYEKAKTDEAKEKVLLENIIAKYSYEISDGLKDPESFKLSHVYYDGEREIVFEIIGKNSYGGNVTNYYDYRYDKSEKQFARYVYLSSLEDEKTYSWDTSSEKLEKILKNVIRGTVIKLMADDDAKVNDAVIDRVNNLFKQGKLRDVELIPQVSIIYPTTESNDV